MSEVPVARPLLTIEDLSVDFGKGDSVVHAVKNVSLHVNRGETLALVGESGSGKSVTAHSVLRLLPYPKASHPTGRIFFEDTDMLNAPESRVRAIRGNRIGMIFQEPATSLNPLHTVEKQISEILFTHRGLTRTQARARTLELLDLVGIDNPRQRLTSYAHQLSGGQRQRVMIAMALANEPDMLIADEPTTALDVTVQAQVMELIAGLKERLSMSVLLITHDLGVVRHFADRVSVMRYGEIVETADTEQLFTSPAHPYTRELLDSEPKGAPVPVQDNSPVVLETRDLRVWFPIKKGVFKRTKDHFRAVDGITIAVRSGRSLGIVGESGSGKSTLGMAVLRLLGSRGEILFEGRPIHDLRQKALRPLRREIQVVFQDPFGSLSPRLPVGDIVSEGLKIHGIGNAKTREEMVVKGLREVGLDPDARHRYPHEFSGGQRQRISIARALVLNPKIIILDEPTSSLDRSVQFQVLELLRKLQTDHGLTYLFISHDLKVVKALCHDIIVMRAGKVVESGPVSQVLGSPREEYTRELMGAAFDETISRFPASAST
ncbi:MAG: ABC transporter ATP-binding protein [Desulfovibrionales bacterium]